MAKKSRRSRRETTKPTVTKRQPASTHEVPSAATPAEAASKRASQAETTKKGPDFSQEYHYVISDLKRVGILAAVLLAGLVALSFVL